MFKKKREERRKATIERAISNEIQVIEVKKKVLE